MPRTSPLLTRVDPALAPLWRDGKTLQFGINGTLRVDAAEAWVEPLVARLRDGILLGSFDLVAHRLGAPRTEARALLDRLRPLLRTDRPPARAAWVEAVNIGDSRVAGWMRDALQDLGVPPAGRMQQGSVGVILVHGAVAAAQLRDYIRSDAPHLPVAYEEGRITAGPLIVPGETPCLACRDGHERDRDPGWPLLHSQLVGRRSAAITRIDVADSARMVDRLLRDPRAGGREGTLSGGGRPVWRAVRFHAECRCRASSFRSPPGSGTPSARDAPPPETRTE